MKKIYAIIALILVVTISKAQMIPNPGFENWTNMGADSAYKNPVGWDCLNRVTAHDSIYTCEKGTPGAVGAAYLKLTSRTDTGGVVVRGIAVSGLFDTITNQPKSGFAFVGRPAYLTGKWQHMIFSAPSFNQGYIDIKLTRWDAGMNTRIIVASNHYDLSGMAMSWANFSIPLNYGTDNNPSDTCIITLSASGGTATNSDFLWIDDLAFNGTESITENYSGVDINLFPIPSSQSLTIDLSALKNEKVTLQIMDMEGKLLKSMEKILVSSKVIVDVADLSEGNYMLSIISKEGIINRKFIKK